MGHFPIRIQGFPDEIHYLRTARRAALQAGGGAGRRRTTPWPQGSTRQK